AQSSFISPVDFSAFYFSAFSNHRITVIEPCLHLDWTLLVSFLYRFWGGKSPARQIRSNSPHRQLYLEPLIDQFHHRRSTPQGVRHLYLVRGLVANKFLNFALLFSIQPSSYSRGAPAGF